jgi:tetratricopeptide (TPR) repeat protein
MKTSFRFSICAALLLVSMSTPACINRYGTKIDGSPGRSFRSARNILARLTNAPPHSAWVEDEARLREAIKQPDAYFGVRSDYATTLLHLGRVPEAIAILESLLKEHPNEYGLNANLGTAYELNGQLEQALKLIKRGVELNRDSHDGSEWIHVNILEAEIASRKNPAWWKSHSVSGLDFGQATLPVAPKESDNESPLRFVADQIIYQLHERLQFVHAPNQPVADLLFDLANYYAVTDIAETADPIYQMASKFDEGFNPLLQTRAKAIHKVATGFSLRRVLKLDGDQQAGVAGVCMVMLMFGLGLWYRRFSARRALNEWSAV